MPTGGDIPCPTNSLGALADDPAGEGMGHSRRSTAPVLALIIAMATPLALGVPPAAGGDQVTSVAVTKPRYESPGGMVPIVVTAWHPPAGYAIAFDVDLVDGSPATCTGPMWRNPIRDTTSQKCYLTLPLTPGAYLVRSRATFSRAGMADIVVETVSPHELKADGYPSSTPMTLARAQAIEHCWNQTDYVWLTFDDSMNPTKLAYVFDLAHRNNVRVRFLLTGKLLAKQPLYPRRVRRHGHLMGNHTYGHLPLSRTADEQVLSQIDRGAASTTSPKLLRPPYGAGAFTTRLESLAARRNYSLCRWTVDTVDWRGDPADVLIERVAYGDYMTPPVGPGGVILMHGHGEHTMEALQGIIDAVRARGLELEPLN